MIHVGDCLDVMRTLDANSVDAIVTDPPYGLGFMGKAWDHAVPGVPFWLEMLRVAKPGAFLVAFGGTRTFHRMACAMEDAGWELRDTLMWVYGSGFPKSMDVSKAIDKAAGAEREVVCENSAWRDREIEGSVLSNRGPGEKFITAPATDAARQWEGWGTALKPAWEPIILARKPLVGTVASNVLAYGTGALNIDGCRVAHDEECRPIKAQDVSKRDERIIRQAIRDKDTTELKASGRWPANLIHDGSEEVIAQFPREAGASAPVRGTESSAVVSNTFGERERVPGAFHADSGSAARFFYCAKADRADRNDGCDGMAERASGALNMRADAHAEANGLLPAARANHHPTVKPTDLMRWLCRLVTPPGGLILDPFTGSGSTGRGAILEGFRFTGIELDPNYASIAEARIAAAVEQRRVETAQLSLFDNATMKEFADAA